MHLFPNIRKLNIKLHNIIMYKQSTDLLHCIVALANAQSIVESFR